MTYFKMQLVHCGILHPTVLTVFNNCWSGNDDLVVE